MNQGRRPRFEPYKNRLWSHVWPVPVPRAREVYKLLDAISVLLDATGAPADIEAVHAALHRLCGPRKALRVDKQLFDDAQSYLEAWLMKESRLADEARFIETRSHP